MTRRPRSRAAALVGALILATAGCGIPAEDDAHVIADDDLPFGLAAEGTTTTTTTPDGSCDAASATATVALYFPSPDGQLVRVPRELCTPYELLDVIDALATEPADTGNGLRSALRPGDVLELASRQGVATLTLAPAFIELPFGEQRLAVAQLVLTLTLQPGVRQTEFVANGEPAQVPRGNGSMARAVSRDDYVEMDQQSR